MKYNVKAILEFNFNDIEAESYEHAKQLAIEELNRRIHGPNGIEIYCCDFDFEINKVTNNKNFIGA